MNRTQSTLVRSMSGRVLYAQPYDPERRGTTGRPLQYQEVSTSLEGSRGSAGNAPLPDAPIWDEVHSGIGSSGDWQDYISSTHGVARPGTQSLRDLTAANCDGEIAAGGLSSPSYQQDYTEQDVDAIPQEGQYLELVEKVRQLGIVEHELAMLAAKFKQDTQGLRQEALRLRRDIEGLRVLSEYMRSTYLI